ncbi:winged helix-turn-helix transcriptional regulator [Phyllobacterium lublinensis]|jgi:DNA-binding HxlR family transcriptional regulator|uniref:winged helix-turn-helix transcriptional regulator n=1 Tax=Phyllobacterium lublinensis TaxID=2875708 RepID=UPI001CCE795B|nr:helix-turn-helix domain-containing protein [Phyllobacterium sp. 2063]MBZ9653383.1 helix-turn-helix transcriptional regulator [Phyllobacterium sp. 2063]
MSIHARTEGDVPLLETMPAMEWDGNSCPMREVLDIIGDTWSLLTIINLQSGPRRFNVLRRMIEGISQRMLTVTLRSLERDGLVTRTVKPTSPPEVTYALTEIGHSIAGPIGALGDWAVKNRDHLRAARKVFDESDAG